MASDDIWGELVDQSKDRAPCSRNKATCDVRVTAGPVYAVVVHSTPGVEPHSCAFCTPGDPQHVVSIESLQGLKRDALIARVARFLNHAHSDDQRTRLRAAA